VAYSTGSHGAPCDLIEAHKWFNLAAVAGHEEAAHCRADISDEMTAREIAEAQRRAREWLAAPKPPARGLKPFLNGVRCRGKLVARHAGPLALEEIGDRARKPGSAIQCADQVCTGS
jgi:hypothetical protein